MKINIAISNIFIAIVTCAFSVVYANDYSIYNDKSRVARNAQPNYESRKVVHTRKTTHVTHHKTVQINITSGSVNQNFETNNGIVIIKILKDRPHTSNYVHSSSYYDIIPPSLVPNLRTATHFRDNAIFIFGYILQRFGSLLTYEQYESLDIVYKAIKWRHVQMYNLLPVLKRLQNKSKANQFRNVLVALSKRLPIYWRCAATDFINEIDLGRFDSESLLTTEREDLNFLADISDHDIELAELFSEDDELQSYDEVSRITESTMGPLFVKLFKSLNEHKLSISQSLFACILRNLPNPDGDAIFNEYIKFVAELAWEQKIPNWKEKLYTPNGKNVYTIIADMTEIICSDSNVSLDIKQALWYIRDRFLRSAGSTFAQSASEAYLITERGLDINLLMSIISTNEFCCGDGIRLKAQLIDYIASHQTIIKDIITGLNKYGYTSPQQLLLAFLARLSTRLPVEEIEIRKSVSSLISILLIKRQLCNLLPSNNDKITLWIIFEMINNSEMSWEIKNNIQMIFQDLIQNVTMWQIIQTIELPSRSDYNSVYIFVRKILYNIVSGIKPSSLSQHTYRKIHEVFIMINTEIGESDVTIPDFGIVPGDFTPHTERSKSTTMYVPTITYHTTERHTPKIIDTTSRTSHYPTTVRYTHTATVIPSKTEHPSEPHKTTKIPSKPHHRTEPHKTTQIPSKPDHPTEPHKTTQIPSKPDHPTEPHKTTKIPSKPDHSAEPHKTTKIPSKPDHPTEPHKTTKIPSKPDHPTEPHKTTQIPSKPDHPTEPHKTTKIPSKPDHPTEPHKTTQIPSKPDHPTEPHKTSKIPSKPDHPTEPHKTTKIPSKPDHPTEPHKTTKIPSKPDHPTEPHKTTKIPSKPDHPAEPHKTTKIPSNPDHPTEPHKTTKIPSKPDHPTEPHKTTQIPSKPDHPTEPHKSTQIPSKPDHPTEPHKTTQIPSTPDHPTEPHKTTKIPSKPDHPTEPHKTTQIPSKPDHPTEPHKTTQIPSKPDHPTEPHKTTKIPSKLDHPTEPHKTTQIPSKPDHPTEPHKTTQIPSKPDHPTEPHKTIKIPSKPDHPTEPHKTTKIPSKPDHPTEPHKTTKIPSKPDHPTEPHKTTQIPSKPDHPTEPHKTTKIPSKPDQPTEPHRTTKIPSKPDHPTEPHKTTKIPSKPDHPTEPHRTTKIPSKPDHPTEPHKTTKIPSMTAHPTTNRHTLKTTESTLHKTTVHTPQTHDTTEKPVIHTIPSESQIISTTTKKNYQTTPRSYTTTERSIESFNQTSTENTHPEDTGLTPVNPVESIQIVLPGIESSNTSNVMTLPSVVCLQEKPSVEHSKHKCDEDIIRITQPLIDTFGENYIEVILGNDWRDRYPTRISLLADLFKKVEYNTVITTNVQLLTIIKKYEMAFELVAPQVILPMIADYQKFDTKVVWTTYNTQDSSETSIGSNRPDETGGHVIAFPMVNPAELVRPVNVQHPYAHLFPELPSNDHYAIKLQPLTTLFETGQIQKLLGNSWNPLQYSNRGTLLISVLRTLLTIETVQTNTQLYNLVNDYLNAVVKPAMDVRLPNSYITTVIHHIETNSSKKYSIIPATVKPEETIHIVITESGTVSVQTSEKPDTPNSLTLPSLVCLQKTSSSDNHHDECNKDLITITQPLIDTFGKNYIQVILGDDWQIRYPTKMSLIVALLNYAEKNPKVTTQAHLVTIIKKYKVAFNFVTSYIILPLLANYKNLTTPIIWSTYNSENPSNSDFGSNRPEGLSSNVIVLPITNPTLWLQPVDVDYPFAGLIPYLPENDVYAIKLRPLQILFMTGKVRQYLGPSWNPAQYPNRGVLFISVLHILEKLETIKSNTELYHLVKNYLYALEGPAINVHIPQTYINQAVYKYYVIKTSGQPQRPQQPQPPQPPITSSGNYTTIKHTYTTITYRNISLFPQSILPGSSIQVEVPESGIPIITSSKLPKSPNIVSLPSIECLQEKLNDKNLHNNCEKDVVHITQKLIKIFGEDYIQVILGNNWIERYSTRLSFLVALLETAERHSKVIENTEVLQLIKRYRIGVRFFVPYVLLPLLADYKEINGSVVWLTYDSENPLAANIGSDRPVSTGKNVQIIPLVNTKIWLLPVSAKYSFDNLLPKLPANDVYANRLQPLITLFESGGIIQFLGTNWNPLQYPNRGALFISVLHILLNSETIQSNTQLYQIVHDLLMVVEHCTASIHIPQSYINKVLYRNEIIFTIAGFHDTIHLPAHGNWKWSEKTYYQRIYETHQTEQVIISPIQKLRFDTTLYVYVSQSGLPIIIEAPKTHVLQNVVVVPSIVCLQKKPNVESSDECSKDLIGITQPLMETFGQNYIEVLLGNNWQSRYPTTISFVVALLMRAESNPKITDHSELLRIIKIYKTVFSFIESSVILPLIFNSQHLTTEIVWSTINSVNPLESNIGSDRPSGLGETVIVFPLVNIQLLLQTVDTAHPFSQLLPNLPANDPYAIKLQPLLSLFESTRIYELLGSSWSPSQYSNRATLLTSVLHILLQNEVVRSDTQLYELVRNYVRAIEIPIRYSMFSRVEIHVTVETNQTTVVKYQIPKSDPKTLVQIIERPLVLPQSVFPGWSIYMIVSESGMVSILDPRNATIYSPNVILPSFDCLQDKPRGDDNPESRCEKDLMILAQHLTKIFGKSYIPVILGNDWQDSYPTRISLLVALLTNAEKNMNTEKETEGITIVRNYKIACEFVASYVLLPILVDSQNLNTLVVWSTFDTAKPSTAYIGTNPPEGLGTNVITLPLANPKLYSVNVISKYPFLNLLPDLPANDPYAIKLKPLSSLIQSGKIYELLGSSWNATNYPNTGSLFISSLRILVESEIVQQDRQLYSLIYNYLIAMQLPAIYSHVSLAYIQSIYQRYNVQWVEDKYVEVIKIPNDIVLPPLIFPKKTLEVSIPKSGSVVVQSMISKKQRSKVNVILPSVDCLQGASSAKGDENADDTCDSILEFRLTEPLIDEFGDDYSDVILGSDWAETNHYPTRISFLAAILRNAVKNKQVTSNAKLFKIVKTYKEALEVAAPYIFLPLIASYQKLDDQTVWLTFNEKRSWEAHMSRNQQRVMDNETITLPIVNPKVWILPVNIHHPFSGFLPDLPPGDPFEEKISPLRSLLDVEYLRYLTGNSWEPSQFPNRGALFVSAMHTLLKLGPTKLSPDQNLLVLHYYMAIEIPSLYVHIPRSYTKNAFRQAPGTWSIDLGGLMVALEKVTITAEMKLWAALKVWLSDVHLLEHMKISLPSLTTSKGEFLLLVFNKALSDEAHLTAEIRLALRTFKSRILTTGAGAGVVGWIWVRRWIATTTIQIGDVFTAVVPIERIPTEERKHYSELVDYFTKNTKLLTTENFPIYRYHTYGAFLRAYLNYLLYKPQISENARKNIELVIPYVRYTGPGATPMPETKREPAP